MESVNKAERMRTNERLVFLLSCVIIAEAATRDDVLSRWLVVEIDLFISEFGHGSSGRMAKTAIEASETIVSSAYLYFQTGKEKHRDSAAHGVFGLRALCCEAGNLDVGLV